MRLSPLEFAGLSLHLEVLVAFRAAEPEDFGVIADESDAFGGVDRARAEMTGLDPREVSVWRERREYGRCTYLIVVVFGALLGYSQGNLREDLRVVNKTTNKFSNCLATEASPAQTPSLSNFCGLYKKVQSPVRLSCHLQQVHLGPPYPL